MDPVIERLLAGSPELRKDFDSRLAKERATNRGDDLWLQGSALAAALLMGLRAGRDFQNLFNEADEILTAGTPDDWETVEAVLDSFVTPYAFADITPLANSEFEDFVARVGPATRRMIDDMLAPIGSVMRAAPNLPDLISDLGPAKIALGAPPEVRPGSAVEVIGLSIGPGGTGGRGIGPNGRYTVKFGDGSTTDVEERFVERSKPTK
jgi:hypothetical protein